MEKHPNVQGTGAYLFTFYGEVKKLLNLTEIYNLFKINDKDRAFEVELIGYPHVPVSIQKGSYVTENSIQSVNVDELRKRIIL